jgi:hypothetical protein
MIERLLIDPLQGQLFCCEGVPDWGKKNMIKPLPCTASRNKSSRIQKLSTPDLLPADVGDNDLQH